MLKEQSQLTSFNTELHCHIVQKIKLNGNDNLLVLERYISVTFIMLRMSSNQHLGPYFRKRLH